MEDVLGLTGVGVGVGVGTAIQERSQNVSGLKKDLMKSLELLYISHGTVEVECVGNLHLLLVKYAFYRADGESFALLVLQASSAAAIISGGVLADSDIKNIVEDFKTLGSANISSRLLSDAEEEWRSECRWHNQAESESGELHDGNDLKVHL